MLAIECLVQPQRAAGLVQIVVGHVTCLDTSDGRGKDAQRQGEGRELHQAHGLARRAGHAPQGQERGWGQEGIEKT